MELTDVSVQTQKSLTLPWQETLLMPIGDVQYGSEGCKFDKFRRHMDWGMKHNAYFIGMGDYLDVASPSGRDKIKSANFYDSIHDALEDKVHEHLDKFLSAVKGSEGRWLGLVHGHHYYEFRDGSMTDKVITDKLKAPYLGTCAIVQVKFKGQSSANQQTAQIWVHHGQGSGATMASPLNKLEKMMSRFPTVDIFLFGHYSRKCGYPVDALAPVFGKNPRLQAKRRIIACTGGFMTGYQVGSKRNGLAHGGYVEEAAMPPTNLGGVLIKMRPVHSRDENRLDLSIEL